MAEVIIPVNYGIATLLFTASGKVNPMTTTIGYRALSAATATEAADEIYECATITGSIAGADALLTGFTFLGVKTLQRAEVELVTGEHLETISGIASGATPPVNVSLLYGKTTGFAGRKFRGRGYLPNVLLKETDIDNLGYIVGSGVFSAYSDRINQWFAQLDASLVVSPYLLHSSVLAPTEITGMIAKSQCATQRRRLRS